MFVRSEVFGKMFYALNTRQTNRKHRAGIARFLIMTIISSRMPLKEIMNDSSINIYMYGMVVNSTILRLVGKFHELDVYGEIAEIFTLPGGEAGNSVRFLARARAIASRSFTRA
jgi:hypothetical protein